MHLAKSKDLSFGLELELQIVHAQNGRLSPSSVDFWEVLKHQDNSERFSLEATLATIELNTSVHNNADSMLEETQALTKCLTDLASPMGLVLRGGGTQLTQFWNERVIAPTERAQELTKRFGFLPKRFSTYGMHVHIGASSESNAILLGNGLQALTPLFIAMSAASPFLQMTDTGFCASRPLEPLIYPHGGPMPRLDSWAHFESIADEIYATDLAESLKDIYWDVRPKPEFGTIEVRVFDTPLSVSKAVAMAAFTRGCAALLLNGSLTLPTASPPATAERVSRFLACRDGLDANLFDPFTQSWAPARSLLSNLCKAITANPVHEADARQIADLHRLCEREQDSQVMRDAWTESQASFRQAPDVLLAYYSNAIGARLLAPLP
jgi:carboxylate-amine ligase